MSGKKIYKVDSNTSANENNKHTYIYRVSPTENEVNELNLIANNNPQKLKQFAIYIYI